MSIRKKLHIQRALLKRALLRTVAGSYLSPGGHEVWFAAGERYEAASKRLGFPGGFF